MIFLCRSLTDITCKSLLISVPGIEVLDLIFLAAKKKNPLVKNFLCVRPRARVRVLLSVSFLPF